jgi:hypothetical protein
MQRERHNSHRRLAIAAPVGQSLLVPMNRAVVTRFVMASVLISACSSSDNASSRTSGPIVAYSPDPTTAPIATGSTPAMPPSEPATSPPPSPTATSNTVATADGCGTVLPSTSLPGSGTPTVMTIAPTTGPLVYTVEARPPAACPGGRVELVVHAHNSGSQVEVAAVGLVIGPIPHIALGEVGPFNVPAGGDSTASITITVPLLPPGRQPIGLIGGSSEGGSIDGGTVIVKDPLAPD